MLPRLLPLTAGVMLTVLVVWSITLTA